MQEVLVSLSTKEQFPKVWKNHISKAADFLTYTATPTANTSPNNDTHTIYYTIARKDATVSIHWTLNVDVHQINTEDLVATSFAISAKQPPTPTDEWVKNQEAYLMEANTIQAKWVALINKIQRVNQAGTNDDGKTKDKLLAFFILHGGDKAEDQLRVTIDSKSFKYDAKGGRSGKAYGQITFQLTFSTIQAPTKALTSGGLFYVDRNAKEAIADPSFLWSGTKTDIN